MSKIGDYLMKQIYIDKNVVTFRSLSRQFGLHVNEAKNELAKFHSSAVNSETRNYATYLVSGQVSLTTSVNSEGSLETDDGMDVDSGTITYAEEDEEVPMTTMTLVGEHDLEHAKSRYARIFSTHVYCLSPSPLRDADYICGPSAIVYKADARDASTLSIALGRVVSADVYVGKVLATSNHKVSEPIPRQPTLKPKADDKPPTKPVEKEKPAPVNSKGSGKLDWSKAKKSSEGDKKDTKVKREESESPASNGKTGKAPEKAHRDPSPQENSKRGTKRKAAPPPVSDTEKAKTERRAPTPVKSDIKLRKNRVVSDDEDEEETPPSRLQRKGQSRAQRIQSVIESQEEASLRAIMDMDDSLVEKASARRPPAKTGTQASQDEDVVMASESEPAEPEQGQDEDMMVIEQTPKSKPRKRKEKKVIPVGRNGLKKKRVMKTRTTVDAKGYMVTEDYSSYESVDEEEAQQEAQKKTKGKKAPPAKPKKESDDETTPPKSRPAARTGSIKGKSTAPKAGGQGKLKDFFGKPKK